MWSAVDDVAGVEALQALSCRSRPTRRGSRPSRCSRSPGGVAIVGGVQSCDLAGQVVVPRPAVSLWRLMSRSPTCARARGAITSGRISSVFFLFGGPRMQEVCGTWEVAEIWGTPGGRRGEVVGFGRLSWTGSRLVRAGLIRGSRSSGSEVAWPVVIARAPGFVVGDCQSPCRHGREDRMSQQTIKQQERRTRGRWPRSGARSARSGERRVIDLAEQVMVAIGKRDAAVAETRSAPVRRCGS